MRFVVLLAIAALVLPGAFVTWSTQVRTAQYACQIAVNYYAPGATSTKASFDLVAGDLRVFGMDGKLIYHGPFREYLDVSGWVEGIYLLQAGRDKLILLVQ